MINHLRGLLCEGQVAVEARALHFPTGQQLLDWVATSAPSYNPKRCGTVMASRPQSIGFGLCRRNLSIISW